ncbi:hypothetical protein NDU88_000579 [Pleurodeles waltl]|uniref:Uncharacterized protein n=1 Tax=Pleurodeles waltl TaxID=8319 RepID=A0AAV7Q1Q4_PLEWA|nr:hypothetical protein NDU88_000579 [Pleurodeles waltl]
MGDPGRKGPALPIRDHITAESEPLRSGGGLEGCVGWRPLNRPPSSLTGFSARLVTRQKISRLLRVTTLIGCRQSRASHRPIKRPAVLPPLARAQRLLFLREARAGAELLAVVPGWCLRVRGMGSPGSFSGGGGGSVGGVADDVSY